MQRILIQLDTDPHASVFDRVVAIDAGVDQLFSYSGMTPEQVMPLVHGAMFTRGVPDLKQTAIFIGGSNTAAGERLLTAVRNVFFGPLRVSVMMDSNGSNTTAAAAVLAASRHLDLSRAQAVILGGTGPVGFRVAQLLAGEGSQVWLTSRSLDKAQEACERIRETSPPGRVTPGLSSGEALREMLPGTDLVIAAGAAAVEFLAHEDWSSVPSLRVAIDVNAVPPLGLAGIEVTDKAVLRDQVTCYGALGVGGTKMKIHKAAIQQLFTSNELILDTDAIYRLGKELV